MASAERASMPMPTHTIPRPHVAASPHVATSPHVRSPRAQKARLSPAAGEKMPQMLPPYVPPSSRADSDFARTPRIHHVHASDAQRNGAVSDSVPRTRTTFCSQRLGVATPRVPPSTLPSSCHLTRKEPVRPTGDDFEAVWDETEESWRVTVFPAKNPSGREQTRFLAECLSQMIDAERMALVTAGRIDAHEQPTPVRLMRASADAARAYRALKSIYSAGMAELARQVSAMSLPRGQLLVNCWASSQLLTESFVKDREEQLSELKAKLSVLEANASSAEERLAETDLREAELAAKAEVLLAALLPR